MADIQFGQNKISKVCSYVIITFRYFKHSNGHLVVLKMQASSGNCPVSSLQTYVCVRPTVPGPLFVFADKSAVSASYFSDVLRRCVLAAGLPINSYKPHSFRVGGATMAAQKGYSEVQIAETPPFGLPVREYILPIFTCCCLSRREAANHLTICAGTPLVISLSTNI